MPEPPDQVALDSTHVKANRCTIGGKGGVGTGDRRRSLDATVLFSRRSLKYDQSLTPNNAAPEPPYLLRNPVCGKKRQ
jgi:hypothetical protein